MKKHPLLVMATASLIASTASAGTMGPVSLARDWSWVAAISAGPTWANAGTKQTFYLTPDIEKSYVARKVSNSLATGELFFGIQKALSNHFQGQFGLALAGSGNANLQGIIWDDADPQFNNYSYKYKISHSRVTVKGKLLGDFGYWLMPWVSGSVGVGFNRAHQFTNTPLIFEAVPNPNFGNHNRTACSYTLGAGVQKTLNQHWQLGLGYEFADWGKSALNRAAAQTLNSGLKLNHLYTNGVLLNITYIV